MEPSASLTSDTFFNGKITVKQEKSGYRYSIDSVLLVSHVKPRPGDRILDLGTGCGIMPLILLYRNPELKVFGIEIQKELADIAVLNIKENHFGDHASIICDDLKNLNDEMTSGPVDLIISNPPYRKIDSGRINPDPQKAVARHEIKVTVNDLCRSARRVLRTGGKFVVVYTADRMIDLFTIMRSSGIEPKFTRTIHSKQDAAAKMVLLEGVMQGQPGMIIGPPLVIYQDNGSYSREVERMFLP